MRTFRLIIGIALLASLTFTAHAAKYKEGGVDNGGSISGVVIYNGAVKKKTVLPTKDKEVCGKTRKVPLVYVGEGGAVRDSVVFLKSVASGKPWPNMERTVVNNVGCIFEPHVQVGRRGKVDIHNTDPVLHNTHGYYGKQTAFNVALPFEGAKVTKIMKKLGELRTDCDAHGWMEGWVFVVENPYFFQTGADGAFTIDDVPPGDYTLGVWQEMIGITELPVSVPAGGSASLTIELGK